MKNWDDMRVFLAVARAESLSAAAPMLKMDPATLARRITRLERDLGTSLFVKSPKGYALTDEGQRVRDSAAEAEMHLNQIREDGQGRSDELTGQIRIGAPDGAANYLLPQVCEKIQADNPSLEVQILALPRVVNLSRREADMAITVSPPETGRLLVQKIADYHLHLAQRADAPPITDLTTLKGRRLVGYIQDMIFDKELDYHAILGLPPAQLASNSVAVQLQMLRQGGVGIVHDFALPTAPELRRVLVDEVSLQRTFYLVRHMSDRHSARMQRFADMLVGRLRAEVSQQELAVSLTEGSSI